MVDGFSEFNSLVINGDTVFAGSTVFVGGVEVTVIPGPAYSIILAGLAGLAYWLVFARRRALAV